MLEIKKDRYYFDLYPNTVISLELNNPILDDDLIKGNYSFPFRLPLTALNKRLLNFPEEIGNVASLQLSGPVQLWVDGILIFPSATLNIKDVGRASVNVFILVGISTFADYASKTKIADVVDHPVRTFNDSYTDLAADLRLHAQNTLSASVDTYPYVFPTLVNNGHYQNQAQEINGGYSKDVVYNCYIDDDFKLKQQVLIDIRHPAGSTHGNLTMVPFLYITYIIRKIFASTPLETNIFESDAALKKLLLFNSFSLDKWYAAFTDYSFNVNNRSIDVKNHVPDIYVGEMLIALKKVFCLFIYKDPFSDKFYFDAFKNVVSSTDYVDWTHIALADYGIQETISKGIKYVPEIGGDGVLSGAATMVAAVRKSAVQREIDLPLSGNTIGDVRMVEETGQLYTYQAVIFFTTWIPYSTALGDYYAAPAQYEIKNTMPGAVPTKVNFYPSENFNSPDEYFVPAVKIPGSYVGSDNQQVTSQILKKLLFYHGIRTSAGGRGYPFASSHNYDRNKMKVGPYSLAWDGADGLYNVWWKSFIRMKDETKEVSIEVQLDMIMLVNLDLRKKVRIGPNNFLIKKISLQLPISKAAKVELWKVD